ncbi:hypothetical protein ES332_A13G202000v1 [Gossypium tomentosum]|uniref:Uncharacterized protein n=1 Tax=Gossypium tomentosum TaxID=34277 RepID=A0A5D2MMP6_GOSTO|nr:hypothetical protein ES332_A13G202000v1 [Gossypium tomentosum]
MILGGFRIQKTLYYRRSGKSRVKIRKRLFLDSILFSFFLFDPFLFIYFWFQIHFKTKIKGKGDLPERPCDVVVGNFSPGVKLGLKGKPRTFLSAFGLRRFDL